MIQRSKCMRILDQILIPHSFTSKVRGGNFRIQGVASYVKEACESSKSCSDNKEDLGFCFRETDYMYVNKCRKDEEQFREELGKICGYGNIELSPFAGILNYGQGILEGVKAYRRREEEGGGIFVFRAKEHGIRMQMGAERMCMPCPCVEQFMGAVKQTALANTRWIPPPGKGSLYIRPLLMGSGPVLGVAPAPEYTFLVYASPVGNYFKEGTEAINMYVEDAFHRTTLGGVKSITNYAPVFKALSRAKGRGFSEVLYLDSVNKRNIEEASASNVFILKGNILSTPLANGTILEGITRKSIMDIATDLGYQVEARPIPIEEVIDADEVFCTGTAVGVAPVGSITYKANRIEYKTATQLASHKLYSRLMEIQRGDIEDTRGWVVKIK